MSVFEGLTLPKVIYKTHSEINGDIEVLQVGKDRRLRVNRITQSMNPDAPPAARMVWGRMVELFRDEVPDVKSVLILGLGGGTMQHMLSQVFPGINIVSVDLDPVIVEVSKKYFGTDLIPHHKMIVGDACRVIVEPQEFELEQHYFDAVIVDIYCGDAFPDLGNSGNFLAHLVRMAKPEGLIAINRIYLQDHQEDVDNFLENVEEFLHDVESIIIPGKTNADNIIIYGRV